MNKYSENRKDELVVPFRGGKLNKDQAKQTGIAIIFGIIGIVVSLTIFGKDQRLLSLILIGFCAAVGFLGAKFIKK